MEEMIPEHDISLKIKSKFLTKIIDNEKYVQMEWIVTNHSEKKLQIVGYYCPFFHIVETEEKMQFKFKGAFVPSREKWIEHEFLTFNEHVRVQLWPGESRVYLWAPVTPSYYGMDSRNWIYRLRIYFQIIGDEGVFYNDASDASIDLKKDEESHDNELLDDFLSNPQHVSYKLAEYVGLDRRLVINPISKKNMYLSYLAGDSKNYTLVETHSKITRTTVSNTEKMLDWLDEISDSQIRMRRRILIGKEVTLAAKRKALVYRGNLLLFIAKIEKDTIALDMIKL